MVEHQQGGMEEQQAVDGQLLMGHNPGGVAPQHVRQNNRTSHEGQAGGIHDRFDRGVIDQRQTLGIDPVQSLHDWKYHVGPEAFKECKRRWIVERMSRLYRPIIKVPLPTSVWQMTCQSLPVPMDEKIGRSVR
jgi:hypothetical protein